MDAADDRSPPFAGQATRFLVTVDTEEEFDWSRPFTRDQHGTRHISALPGFQARCERWGVRPLYLVDYPVAADPAAVDILGRAAADGRADIGAQLHPWVNPPLDEPVSDRNSYLCNLPPALQRAKIAVLTSLIAERFGGPPRSFRAGRYGIGAGLPAMLVDAGYRIDTSVRSRFDYRDQHGPDFRANPVAPYWLAGGNLAELPLTTVFDGLLHRLGPAHYPAIAGTRWAAIAGRAGLLRRVPLTPEGVGLPHAIGGLRRALAARLPLIVLSFHSPSLLPGCTPYVRDAADLARFEAWWDGVFGWLAAAGVAPVNEAELLAELDAANAACQPAAPSANGGDTGACSSVG